VPTANKLGLILGAVVIVIALAAAPMPLVSLGNSSQPATIYPNLLFAVPLTLLGVLLAFYGMVADKNSHKHEPPE